MAETHLCRGWKESDIRALLADASEKQRRVLLEIADNPHTTTEEIAHRLGWDSHLQVRAVLGALAKTSNALGVRDSAGKLSWPFHIENPVKGSTFWRYVMPEEAADVVRRGA